MLKHRLTLKELRQIEHDATRVYYIIEPIAVLCDANTADVLWFGAVGFTNRNNDCDGVDIPYLKQDSLWPWLYSPKKYIKP